MGWEPIRTTLETTSSRARPICARCTTATAIPDLFAAYNVGPARFEGYLQHGVPLPEETLHYLMTIGPDVREAIVAQRPDVAVGLTARVARTVASMSENGLFFPL